MAFCFHLLDMLGCRPACAGFKQSTTVDERHDREHLGAGAQFQDREKVSEVIPQDVARD